ncbi:MAG: LysR substrate-binding domain-containing protein [Syntrophobacteraceae bacterium]|nr:LysR substrate-binding domain-containing protein [Syntrophobacteraceae bacterium]
MLTDAGRAFLEQARAVLSRAASAQLVLSEFGGLKRGALRLVASHTIAGYWLPRCLAAFRALHPPITLELAIANTEQAKQSVLAGTAELGFVEGAVDDPDIVRWPIAYDRLVLVGAAPPPAVDKHWVRSARWIMRERGSGARSTFEEALQKMGVDPETLSITLTLPSNEAVRTAVEAGAGVAVLSSLVVAGAIDSGGLNRYPLTLPERPFFALRHRERYQTRAACALLDFIRKDTP